MGGAKVVEAASKSECVSTVCTAIHIEDDRWFADFIRGLMSDWPDIRHVGAAATGAEGIALCHQLCPDLVLLDLRLPDIDGFSVAKILAAETPVPAILALTARTDEYTFYRLRQSPIRGLLWKSGDIGGQLRPALEEVLVGRRYFSSEVKAKESALRCDPQAIGKILLAKDIALLPFWGRGDADDQIAAMTGLSLLTVKWRRCRLMQRLDLHNRVELMRWAQAKGFVD